MKRNLKALGLALVAVFAMSALTASAASALEYHAEKAPVSLHGSQSTAHEFTTQAGTVTCATATFTGTQATSTSKNQTVNFDYTTCTNPLLGEVTIDTNGCDYNFTEPAKVEKEKGVFANEAQVDIVCPESKSIAVTGGICTIDVGSQNGLVLNTLDNEGAGSSRDVKVTTAVTGIKYTQTGVFCPGNGFSSSKTFTDGTYTGSTTMSGKDSEGKADGIWVE